MSTIYYKTCQNYYNPRKVEEVHVPQPFLNYGGLSKMSNDNIHLLDDESKSEYRFHTSYETAFILIKDFVSLRMI